MSEATRDLAGGAAGQSGGGEILDVAIVGGGLSGIGAACWLRMRCPGKSFAILEARDRLGGTWDLFRYPGVRSDSDMHTLGFAFKPWRERKAIADGPSILAYLKEAARDYDLLQSVRFGHRVRRARWSSAENLWTLEIERPASDAAPARPAIQLRARLLSLCGGYYRYDRGHPVHFEGEESFRGRIVHPQFWPEDLDFAGKRIAVIGSGATAMTLVPAMAKAAGHVTMVQRSPTWVVSRPEVDRLALLLRSFLPETIAYRLTRWKNVLLQRWVYRQTRVAPNKVAAHLLAEIRSALGPSFDVGRHFTPRYSPWDQRLCLVPDGDLFEAIKSGRASVVTDRIRRFTPTGIELESGQKVEADIIVTATGLELQLLGGIAFEIDGEPVDFSKRFTYRNLMFADVPNLIQTFGYVNASWTLRADLNAEFVCRLLAKMDERGAARVTPRLRPEDRGMQERPWIEGFTPGYIQRMIHLFPKQGDREPWTNTQDYVVDRKTLRTTPFEDGVLSFER